MSGGLAYRAEIDGLRAIAVTDKTGARILDPADRLCNATLCPTATPDGTILYRDDNHLSVKGAEWLARQWPLPSLLSSPDRAK